MTSSSFPESLAWAAAPFDLIHMDLKTLPVLSYHKYKYILTFLDDHTSHSWISLLKNKSDTAKAIELAEVHVMIGRGSCHDQQRFMSWSAEVHVMISRGSCHDQQLWCQEQHSIWWQTRPCHMSSSSKWIHHKASFVAWERGIWEPCTTKEGQWWRNFWWWGKHLEADKSYLSYLFKEEFELMYPCQHNSNQFHTFLKPYQLLIRHLILLIWQPIIICLNTPLITSTCLLIVIKLIKDSCQLPCSNLIALCFGCLKLMKDALDNKFEDVREASHLVGSAREVTDKDGKVINYLVIVWGIVSSDTKNLHRETGMYYFHYFNICRLSLTYLITDPKPFEDFGKDSCKIYPWVWLCELNEI